MIVEKQSSYSWGKSIVENLAKDLLLEFPDMRGFFKSNLWAMSQFYIAYKDNEFLQLLFGEISWAKHLFIMR